MMSAFLLNFAHNIPQCVHAVCPQHKINMGRTLDECLAFLLRHTSRNTKDKVWILFLQMFHFANLAIDSILRCLTNAAGIDKDEICFLHMFCRLIPDGRKLPLHPFRITHIHLTSIDKKFYTFLLLQTLPRICIIIPYF